MTSSTRDQLGLGLDDIRDLHIWAYEGTLTGRPYMGIAKNLLNIDDIRDVHI